MAHTRGARGARHPDRKQAVSANLSYPRALTHRLTHPSFQPVIPVVSKHASKKAHQPPSTTDEDEDDDALAALVKGIGAIDIKGKTAGSRRVVLKAADGTALADVFAALSIAPQKTDPPKTSKWKPIGRADSTKNPSRQVEVASSHESDSQSTILREDNKENTHADGGEDKRCDKSKALPVQKEPSYVRPGKGGPLGVDSVASLVPRTVRVKVKTVRGSVAP